MALLLICDRGSPKTMSPGIAVEEAVSDLDLFDSQRT